MKDGCNGRSSSPPPSDAAPSLHRQSTVEIEPIHIASPPSGPNLRPNAPPQRAADAAPPSYDEVKDSSVVIPNMTYIDSVGMSGELPPPPSYEDVVSNCE